VFLIQQPETTPVQIYPNDIDGIDDIDKSMLQFRSLLVCSLQISRNKLA